jgi:hypothetical protein
MAPTIHKSTIRKSELPRYTFRTTLGRTEYARRVWLRTHKPRNIQLPNDIISAILHFSHVREEEQPVFLRPKESHDKHYNNRQTIDKPAAKFRISHPHVTTGYLRPPTPRHTAPSINLLLVNKLFRNEGYKRFYADNVFSIAGMNHADDILRLLDRDKRNHIRHVSLDSQREFKVGLGPDVLGKLDISVGTDWGDVIIDKMGAFPNIRTITLRIRCTARLGEFTQRFGGFQMPLRNSGVVRIEKKAQALSHAEIRDGMKAWIASDIEDEYEEAGFEHLLPIVKVAFLYSETKKWRGDEHFVPLVEIERDHS